VSWVEKMSTDEILNGLREAVINFDADKAMEYSKKAVKNGIDPSVAISEGLAKGLREIGERFEKGELFLMHIVAAAETAKKPIDEVLQPELAKKKGSMKSLGKVVLGTVSGDIHDIGKNLVAALLFAAGFEVIDLGKDVSTEVFVRKVKETEADIVGASALLSTTLPMQKDLVEALKKAGIREKVKVMIGGAPVTKEWAEEIGADGVGVDAMDAVRVAKELVGAA